MLDSPRVLVCHVSLTAREARVNTIPDKPESSDLTKVVLLIGMLWICVIAAAAFWWAMTAIMSNHLGLPAAIAASAIYTVLILAITQAFNRAWFGATGRTRTPAVARRDRRTMISATVYAVLLLAVIFLRVVHPLQGVLAYALAVLPALPVLGMAWAIGLYLREETDEFERAVCVENALWATGATLSLATIWGFAEMLADAPHVPGWLWFPVWALSTSIADIFTRRRYR
jgi:hypothetical protein